MGISITQQTVMYPTGKMEGIVTLEEGNEKHYKYMQKVGQKERLSI